MNTESRWMRVLRWLFAVAAYGWLAWCLWHYDDYASLRAGFLHAGWLEWLCIGLCVLLMPLNIRLEARRWQTLLQPLAPVSVKEAERQVYGGMPGAFLTPYRAGELPARVCLMPDRRLWKEALAAGVLGSGMMTLVVVAAGVVPAVRMLPGATMRSLWCRAAAVLLTLAVSAVMFVWWTRRRGIGRMNGGQVARLAGWTVLRYACFSLQMGLMLYFAGIRIPWADMLTALPVYYLLVTLTPNMPVADAGIRGGWAVFVFARYAEQVPMIALAAVMMWGVNTVIPVLIGTFLNRRSGGCRPDDGCIAPSDGPCL